jgi:hypothetical protein
VDLDSSTGVRLYYGDVTATTALIDNSSTIPNYAVPNNPNNCPRMTGGVVSLQPFVFVYGADGTLAWCQSVNLENWTDLDAGMARVTGDAIVFGAATRGGAGNSPSGLFWSLSSLIKCSYVGGTPVFAFDTISSSITIVSHNAAVEYGTNWYWMGTDKFYVYNGVVNDLPNESNREYLFKNLNWQYQEKIWSMRVSRWSEIWWFVPLNGSTECNHAFIYNVDLQVWYDTPINMSAGYPAKHFRWPLMCESVVQEDNTWALFMGENGVDEVRGPSSSPIEAYAETCDMNFGSPNMDMGVDGVENKVTLIRFEPDIIQSGQMTLVINGGSTARGQNRQSEAFPFDPTTV